MKKFFILSIAMISLFYMSENTRADSIIEPYAGAFLNSTYDSDSLGSKGDIAGTSVGVRLGFSQKGFMAGLDGRRNFITLESDAGTDLDYTFSQLGFFVGYEMPVKLRFWGEYIFSHEGTDDDDSDSKLKKGSGTLVGIGYAFLPFVSVNLEISNVTTTEVSDASGTSDADVAYSQYLVSISLPLHL